MPAGNGNERVDMKEATIQRKIQEEIRKRGGKVYKLHGNQYGVAGQPDLVGALDGVSFAIEVKRPGGVATAKQAHELRQWAAQGWATGVATCVEEAMAIITLYREEA